MVFGCGETEDDRQNIAAARSLVSLGASAIPNIEEALDSIEKFGKRSEFAINAGLLLDAYARIKTQTAYSRLRRMIENPELHFLGIRLDSSVARAFGLTSYVSGYRAPMRIVHCRGEEPRDALDHLILAWERNDRALLESSLGPNAKVALDSLLAGRTWEDMRTELWRGKSGPGVALGYRFAISGRWSEPEIRIEDDRNSAGAVYMTVNPELDTLFRNVSGDDCGRRQVKFLNAKGVSSMYLVDNSDLRDLLSLLASCAVKTSGRR